MDEFEEIKDGEQQISIQLDEKISGGVYSNLVVINHSSTEFVLDFVSVMPGMPQGKVRSRVILTPEHAKRLLFALEDNIQKFEETNGTITDNKERHRIPLFGITGQA
jgi:hypothetical protein